MGGAWVKASPHSPPSSDFIPLRAATRPLGMEAIKNLPPPVLSPRFSAVTPCSSLRRLVTLFVSEKVSDERKFLHILHSQNFPKHPFTLPRRRELSEGGGTGPLMASLAVAVHTCDTVSEGHTLRALGLLLLWPARSYSHLRFAIWLKISPRTSSPSLLSRRHGAT